MRCGFALNEQVVFAFEIRQWQWVPIGTSREKSHVFGSTVGWCPSWVALKGTHWWCDCYLIKAPQQSHPIMSLSQYLAKTKPWDFIVPSLNTNHTLICGIFRWYVHTTWDITSTSKGVLSQILMIFWEYWSNITVCFCIVFHQ